MNAKERREREASRKGAMMIVACAAVFAAMLFGAYQVDRSQGITVDQSLRSAGL